jgi:peptidoglycan/xylan/chitin deacetylase (PgdA/CDA1 family)
MLPKVYNRSRLAVVAALALTLLCTNSCASARTASAPPAPSTVAARPAAPAPPPPPSPASVHANELGEVPVLMYHRIVPDPSSVYDRTPQDFRAELERLAAENYVPITTADYVTGNINIPAGKHPVVLTFDDGSTSQFTLDSSGRPAPNTAVAILQQVAAEHPGFPAVATFYVNDAPFGDPTGKTTLTWLHDHGFAIGNHTLHHVDLNDLAPADVQQEIAGLQREVTDAVPGVAVRTLALPDGVSPHPASLAMNGSANGVSYHYAGVLLVGANPAPSPFAADFDPSAIPRIRSEAATGEQGEYCSTAWLDRLDANPDLRYTSDGDPQRISVPAQSSLQPAPAFANRVQRY